MMFPAMAALMCGVIIRKDKKLKNHAVLILPVDLEKVWDGKVLYGLCATGAGLTFMFLLILAGEILGRKFTFIITNTPVSYTHLLHSAQTGVLASLGKKTAKVYAPWHLSLIHIFLYNTEDSALIKNLNMYVVSRFYLTPYDKERDFYEQFYERLKEGKELLALR